MLRRLLFTLGKLLFLFALPFFLLIRGSVFLHENYALSAWGSMLGGVFMSAALLFVYISYLHNRLAGRAGNAHRTYGLAFALAAVYCLPGLFYLSASNAKEEPVRQEFTSLHPVLRLGVSTLAFRACSNFVFEATVSKFYFRQGAKREPSVRLSSRRSPKLSNRCSNAV